MTASHHSVMSTVESMDDQESTEPLSQYKLISDSSNDNGFVLGGVYIPEELLLELLCHFDHKSLLSCQQVCRRWRQLLQDCVWRKKAERSTDKHLPVDSEVPWFVYYFICDGRPFDKNLIKNHSGELGVKKGWKRRKHDNSGWIVECPPAGVPELPEDPVFEGKEHCFVTSYYQCSKSQIVDLVAKGFPESLLDRLQPTIHVSEWYSCRWDCAAWYGCVVELLNEKGAKIDSHEFYREIKEDEQRYQWYKWTHEFKKYGVGVRKVRFYHTGKDRQNWAGHYGSKMAGACVKLEIPKFLKSENSTTPT